MTIPHDHPDAGELHAELDRLDRELEALRKRLADEQGALHDAQARCRALDESAEERAAEPDPEPNGPASIRRIARTSRLSSARLGSRPAHVALRAIPGGALPRARVTDLAAARAAAAAAARSEPPSDDPEPGPPEAA